MTKYFKVKRGNEMYEYAEKLFNVDVPSFVKEVSEMLGFEANKNFVGNSYPLLIRPEAIKEHKTEWIPMFKKSGKFLTPKASLRRINEKFKEIQNKYNANLSIDELWVFSCFSGDGEIVFDFDKSGYLYVKAEKVFRQLDEDINETTEIEYLKRDLAYKEWLNEKKKLKEEK